MSMLNAVQGDWRRGQPAFRPTVWNGEGAATAVVDAERFSPEFYDLEYAERTEDIGFYQRLAFEAEDPVLELACGTGRLAIPLARMGSRVVGLENDPALLAVCRGKRDRLARALKGALDLVAGDLRQFSLEGRFRLIISAFDSFLALTTLSERDACLTAVARHLAEGGRFVVDVAFPDPSRLAQADPGEVLEQAFYWPEGRTTVMKYRRTRLDLARQELLVDWDYRYHDDAGRLKRRIHRFTLGLVFPNEMRLLLERHGFTVKEVFGSYGMEPLTGTGSRMIFVAEKA